MPRFWAKHEWLSIRVQGVNEYISYKANTVSQHSPGPSDAGKLIVNMFYEISKN